MTIADEALNALTGAAKGAATGAVLGPIGAAAGGAIGLASALLPGVSHLLIGDKDTADKVTQVVQAVTGTADPEAQTVAVASNPEVEADLRTQLAQIAADRQAARDQAQLEAIKAQFADVVSARARDVEIRQAENGRNVRADVMLGAVTVGLLACIVAAATGRLGADTAVFGLVAGIAGMLSGCFKDAFGFEFGSSRQSETKTGIIAGLARDGRQPTN